jgi:hypothetical protein
VHGRGFIAATFVAATVALTASAGFATPAKSGSVTVRQGQWVGLQINIAGVRPGGRFEVKAAQANDSVTALKPVMEICRRCAVGVNADFFDTQTRQPIGGVIVGGVVLRSPNPHQNQLTFGPDGHISAGLLRWHAHLTAGPDTLPVAVNDPHVSSPVLYDRHYGTATPRGAAVELAFAPRPAALYLRRPITLRYKGPHGAGTAIPPGEVVLRATGAWIPRMRKLESRLRKKHTATLNLATDPKARDSLGANHILLQGGQLVPINEDDSFANDGNPRTLFGWDEQGRVTLVTIGSARPGHRAGVSLAIAARIMQGLGLTNAVNLDGGGSSTFVSNGRVRNNPSDGSPRSVTNAWLIVPAPPAATKHAHPRTRAKSRATVRPKKRISRSLVGKHPHRQVATEHVAAAPPPSTTTMTAPPPTTTLPARRLEEQRPALRATALRVPPGLDTVIDRDGAPRDDRLFDVLLVVAVVGFGVAMTLARRRAPVRPRRPRA